MIQAKLLVHNLYFKKPAKTSRDTLTQKKVYLILLKDFKRNKIGIGECGYIAGLSVDKLEGYQDKLNEMIQNIHLGEKKLLTQLIDYPSIQFGLEMAFKFLNHVDKNGVVFPSPWTYENVPLRISGLVWMGSIESMKKQIKFLLKRHFRCLKLKVGGLDFDRELELIKMVREMYPNLVIRLDANGAWGEGEQTDYKIKKVMKKIEALSPYNIHSIEQPVAKNSWGLLKQIVRTSPIPVALDEELIGVKSYAEQKKLLTIIQPHYLVLKPSLLGGIQVCEEWIKLAVEYQIGWWITSALESSWGLNYLAQWVANLALDKVQGLGTGLLYKNNFPSALEMVNDCLYFSLQQNKKNWLELNQHSFSN